MKIKATSINNLTDARYFAAWNVEWLGFSLEMGNSNYTRPQDVKEIKDWLVGPKIVGEFGIGQNLAEIQTSVELLNLDAVQLSMFADTAIAQQLSGKTTVIQEWVLEKLEDLNAFEKQCETSGQTVDFFYLDLEKNGISWQNLKQSALATKTLHDLCQEYAIFVSILCPASELKDFINSIQPYGISLQGGAEEKVGVKSFDDLDEIFEALEELNILH